MRQLSCRWQNCRNATAAAPGSCRWFNPQHFDPNKARFADKPAFRSCSARPPILSECLRRFSRYEHDFTKAVVRWVRNHVLFCGHSLRCSSPTESRTIRSSSFRFSLMQHLLARAARQLRWRSDFHQTGHLIGKTDWQTIYDFAAYHPGCNRCSHPRLMIGVRL